MNDFAPLSRQQLSDKDFARLRVALVQAKMQFNLLAQSAAQHDDYISELIYLLRVKELDDDLDFIVHYNKAIEFIPKGSSKATGIERVCNIFNIDHEDVYAIGDGPNDIDMLNYVKHSIVMGNGTDDAKAAAEYVTTDIHDNGVYNAMKHYALI